MMTLIFDSLAAFPHVALVFAEGTVRVVADGYSFTNMIVDVFKLDDPESTYAYCITINKLP